MPLKQVYVLGISDVLRGAAGVEDHGAFVFRLFSFLGYCGFRVPAGAFAAGAAWAFALAAGFGFGIFYDGVVDVGQDLVREPLPEIHKERRVKRRSALIARKANEVLVVRVFLYLCHEFAVGIGVLLLDDQRAERHAQGLCACPCEAREKGCIFVLDHIPGDVIGFLYPSVFWIKPEAEGLVEVFKGYLRVLVLFIPSSMITWSASRGSMPSLFITSLITKDSKIYARTLLSPP